MQATEETIRTPTTKNTHAMYTPHKSLHPKQVVVVIVVIVVIVVVVVVIVVAVAAVVET
jgi:uncharacterized membrane protein